MWKILGTTYNNYQLSTHRRNQPFENIVGKKENAGPMKDNFNILSNICRLQMLSIWTSLKFCCLVMG